MSQPRRFHLSSRVVAVLDDATSLPALPGVFASEAWSLRARFEAAGEPLAFETLTVAEFGTLRAIARRLGLVDEGAVALECDNCRVRTSVLPCDTLELGPFEHGELDDPELDAPFDFEASYPVAQLGLVRLAPLTVREATPLYTAVVRPGGLRFTSDVVRGLGIVAVDGVEDPRRIARRLRHASDETLDDLASLFEQAHYGPRLHTRHPCPGCGTALWVLAPAERELSSGGNDEHVNRTGDTTRDPFPDLDRFEILVGRVADRVFAENAVQGVGLVVEGGPAQTDAGGTPLLGSYVPPDPDGMIPADAEITLYHRTFENQWLDRGPYDVEGDIEETLRHELTHHAGYLSGEDPLDERERDEIAREELSRVGPTETSRRELRAAARGLREFVRVTWWIWVLAALGAAAATGGW